MLLKMSKETPIRDLVLSETYKLSVFGKFKKVLELWYTFRMEQEYSFFTKKNYVHNWNLVKEFTGILTLGKEARLTFK